MAGDHDDRDNDDVKDLLGRALAEEPPLRIDRDEVFRQGRRKLRSRRCFEAGSVVAARSWRWSARWC